ncbi:MAG: hypothetical protein OXB88_07020 [Bacteriovoracales bacterium]|nr:hypothetical protein [Bacteriovoracales bacterium]
MKRLTTMICSVLMASAFASESLSYSCKSLEDADDALSQYGESPSFRAAGSSHLKIIESKIDDLRHIVVTGYVIADYVDVLESDEFDPETAEYRGDFSAVTLVENPHYRPWRYKGYSQFRELDSTGSMWGELVVERKTEQEKFKAHYIFKAGDHMGGTLHMTCTHH